MLTYLRTVSIEIATANERFARISTELRKQSEADSSNHRGDHDPDQQSHKNLSTVSKSEGRPCVLCTVVPLQEPRELTDRICAARANDNNPSKIKARHRTEMSAASMATAFSSLISRALRGQPKPNFTLRILCASIREQLVAGLRPTMSRLRKRSASSSAKSCVDITSATKARRRPF